MNREERLPKWVQDELKHLRMKLADAENAFSQATLPWSDDADVLVGFRDAHGHALHGDHVSFLVHGGPPDHRDRINAHVSAEAGRHFLDIHSNGQSLRIEPRASNSIRVYLESR